MLTVGGLFSGIGGWELGLERAGMEIAWHCEADPFCRKVLAKHWPDVPCYEDVCGLTGADVRPVDVLCGGFPCQDISVAGKGAGIDGARSGLWSEYARLIGEIRPRYVCVENVSALLGRGFDRVLGDLAELGYDAEWSVLRASEVGAPHRRARVWVVAYPHGQRVEGIFAGSLPRFPEFSWVEGIFAGSLPRFPEFSWVEGIRGITGLRGRSDLPEPLLSRKDDGLSRRMDSLGNALVPQIAQWIGERIVSYEASLDGETVALDL